MIIVFWKDKHGIVYVLKWWCFCLFVSHRIILKLFWNVIFQSYNLISIVAVYFFFRTNIKIVTDHMNWVHTLFVWIIKTYLRFLIYSYIILQMLTVK